MKPRATTSIEQEWSNYQRICERFRVMEAMKRQYPDIDTGHAQAEMENARKLMDRLIAELDQSLTKDS